MAKPGVFITRRIPEKAIEMLAAEVEMDIWQDELPPPYETLLEKVTGKDGLLCLLTDKIDARLMDHTQGRLKVISQMAVGFDNIDLPAATARKIPVGNTPGVLTETTADFAWSLLMAAGRRVVEADRFTRAGRWKTWGPTLLLGQDISGATLGIIGFGRIGQAVARRAAGFGMKILVYDVAANPEAERELGVIKVNLDTLLRESDYITIHTSLTEQTHHLIGPDQFKKMKSTAVLVNTSRGPVVDQRGLYQALKDGEIGFAAIDVTEKEPIPLDDPILTLDNLVITPHIASASVQTRTRMAVMAAQNLLAGLEGKKLPYCANPQVYQE